MMTVPSELQTRFHTVLNRNSVPVQQHHYYKKWLRYYWDFCHKYYTHTVKSRTIKEAKSPLDFQEPEKNEPLYAIRKCQFKIAGN
ncbi:MAG: hypothetical protein GY749_17910 [Desulfobacteraceae bacterium]|nr:hypothetical protein [Desulfobacteraceae bacterium]